LVRRRVSVARHKRVAAADHPPYSGIFHPLGAAFLSNASYPETLKVLDQTNVPIESFQLAGARQMYRYNYTSGAIELNPPLAAPFLQAVTAEIPRYIALWNQRFRPISTTNYKVRQMRDVTQDRYANAGTEWRTRGVHRIRIAMVPEQQPHCPSAPPCQSCRAVWLWRHQHRPSRKSSAPPPHYACRDRAYRC
jgi:hypothetical protein